MMEAALVIWQQKMAVRIDCLKEEVDVKLWR